MSDKLIEAVAEAFYGRAQSRHGTMTPWSLLTSSRRIVWLSDARAALAAIEASGFVVVPKEPTEEMRELIKGALPVEYDMVSMNSHAGEDYPQAVRLCVTGLAKIKDQVTPESVYAAMLTARPKVTT